MDNLTLREAGSEDSAFAYGVKRAAFREYVEQVWGWDEDVQRRFHEEQFAAQDVRVIQATGVDVGIMAMVVMSDCVQLNQLFLLPEYQGKGIGRACLSRVMEEAQRLGLPVRLRVLKVNPRAAAFYRRLGFVRTGATETHELMEWAGGGNK